MAWSISNAMMKAYENSRYSRELAVESLVVTCSDGELSAQSNTTPTPDQYYWPDKTTEHSRLSRFGMTCAPLTESLGEDLLTWFRAGFPARTLAPLERELELMERKAASGVQWQGSFARFNQDTSMWKTAQCSLVEGLDVYSETWPKWGSMQNGAVYLRSIPELHTGEIECGFWPTPCASDNVNRQVSDNVHITKNGLPKHVAPNGEKSQMRLSQAVKMWRTPNASDANKWSKQSLQERLEKGQQIRLNTQVSQDGSEAGLLNPEWTEWLMAFPIGWTDLKPLEMHKFQEWRQQHGRYSADEA